MKKLAIVLISFVILQQCDTFKSKEELLTEKKWGVYRYEDNRVSENGESSTAQFFYKKYEKDFEVKFNLDGTVYLKKHDTVEEDLRWKWGDNDKTHIIFESRGFNFGKGEILELNGKELKWFSPFYDTTIIETLLHIDNPDWTDEKVDQLNGFEETH